MIENFKTEIDLGLSSTTKKLPSKYFYNKKGDALFVEIMNLPEYYLTRSEFDIFKNKTQDLIQHLGLEKNTFFELIELGAGDGTKTKQLLKSLSKENYSFNYLPIDISHNALSLLKKDLQNSLPKVLVHTQQGDYFEVLASLKQSNHPKVVLFLGSNIGNMEDAVAAKFLKNLAANLQTNDTLLLGVDLIKAKEIILPAYNDSKGVTAQFNLNLLQRINDELGGNFNLDDFDHAPEYNEREGIAKSYIVSNRSQTVHITATGNTYHFNKGEKIHTEISRKYNDALLQEIIKDSDLHIQTKIVDSKQYFADYILKKQ
ncbi:L-histidine N(alpha)-methyltransferase [Ochrovirga pacifica]|uniref:L-histidine N(alpha)-methyltransferase n=1 Tax=Ochrovirga pacifica TaxID=1042376 RepID=UPI000255836C|nr:L-histidine N(alpha)-methyltransferase [Ochrovirga pacifica]